MGAAAGFRSLPRSAADRPGPARQAGAISGVVHSRARASGEPGACAAQVAIGATSYNARGWPLTGEAVSANRHGQGRGQQTGAALAWWLVGIVAAAGLLLALWIWFMLSWSYSSGERAGWVQKLSKKGWLCKTWEGEMAMVSLPGSV